jgi:hypothetical protein
MYFEIYQDRVATQGNRSLQHWGGVALYIGNLQSKGCDFG